MKKILIFCISICLNLSQINFALAEENTQTTEEVVSSVENSEATAKIIENVEINKEKEPEYEVVHKVEVERVPLPTCDDATLVSKTSEYITSYLSKNDNAGTLYRRRRYFILHNLDKFTPENIANYKTAATRPVSDIIADVKMNSGVAEENMLLCKNQSSNKFAGKLYSLVYPFEDGYKVILINLAYKSDSKDETSFTYKN